MNGEVPTGIERLPEPETPREAELVHLLRAARMDVQIPELGHTMRARHDGLYLPEGLLRVPSPIDSVLVYATASDIFGTEPGVPWIMDVMEHVSLADVLLFATTWSAKLGALGSEWDDVDREFVELYLRNEARQRALAILRDPHRRILVPQALLVMIKIALFRCEMKERTQAQVNLLPVVLFAIASSLNATADDVAERDLVGEMIANQNFNNSVDIATSMALYDARWHDEEYANGSEPLAVAFESVTGLNLADVEVVVLGIWAHLSSGGSPAFQLGLVEGTVPPGVAQKVLELISATPDRMRTEIERIEASQATAWNSVPWTFSPFERFPLVCHESYWFVLSPAFLVDRLLTWLPVFDVASKLSDQGEKGDIDRFEGRVRMATERYVQSVVGKTYDQAPGRVYTEVELRAELGAQHKVADVAIDYGHSWVVAEISTRRLMRASAHGGGQA